MYGNGKTKITKLQRLYKIHQIINSGKRPLAKELANELGCKVTTIYEDIQFLKGYKDPVTGKTTGFLADIKCDEGIGGYYYASTFRFPFEDEMIGNSLGILSSAKFLLTFFENTPFYGDIEKSLNAICGFQTSSPLLNRIALAPSTNTKEKFKPHVWKQIETALSKNLVLKFHYSHNTWDPDLEESPLHVQPYQLLIDEGKNLLFGYLEEKKALRLYNINKMELVSYTMKSFVLPDDYEFKNHSGNSNFGAFTRYATRTYRIAFYEDAIEEVKEGNWAKNQSFEDDIDEEGYPRTIITFTSSQDMRILDWVCKNKCYAKPLEPESLVLRWKYNVAIMAKTAGFNVEVDENLRIRAEELEKAGK